VIHELDLHLAGRPRFLAVSRDISGQPSSGDVWFTESAASFSEPPFFQSGAIWRINPTTLEATRYAIPKNYADPWGIAVGPDRTVWVRDGQDLLKVSETSGVVAIYPIPWWTNDNIAVDPRSGVGRVWLTGSGYPDSYLVSFDPSTLQFTRINIGGFSDAHSVEVDDGGNVWFAGRWIGQIGVFRPEEGSMSLFNLGSSEGVRVLETTHDARFPAIFTAGNRIGILSASYGERSTATSTFPGTKEGALVATTWTYVTTTMPASVVYQTTTTISTGVTKTTISTTYSPPDACMIPSCIVTTAVTETVYGSTTTTLQTTTATVFEIPYTYTSTRVGWTGTYLEYQGTVTIPVTTETAYLATSTTTIAVTLGCTTYTCQVVTNTVTVATRTVPGTLALTSYISTVTVTNPTLTPATETASVSTTTPDIITSLSTSLQLTTMQEIFAVSAAPTTSPVTTPAPPPSAGRCIIATAAYGSELASDVVYMRYVRDNLIGSTSTGRLLVAAFNSFYYSWSPAVAKAIAGSEFLRAMFRVILLPLIAIVHVAAFSFMALTPFGRDAASLLAFLCAAALSIAIYFGLPTFVILQAWHPRGKSRANTKRIFVTGS
jgi:hypothetical protein